MRVGNLVLRRHMLLHGLAGARDSQQDEGIREENNSAGDNIAEEEQADDVAHSREVLAWSVPVDATGCAIRLGRVFSPARQGADSKNSRVAPHPCDQHVGVAIRKLVTCGEELQIREEITTMIIRQSGCTHVTNICEMIKVMEQYDIIAVCFCLEQQMSSSLLLRAKNPVHFLVTLSVYLNGS